MPKNDNNCELLDESRILVSRPEKGADAVDGVG